ncbi:MAG TPA: hypothetical protein VGG08_10880 [Solirubrobacteraceae bacterium]
MLLLVPGAASAALQLSKWEAGTCNNVECTDAGNQGLFYTQAAGHPNFGITDFAFTSKEQLLAKVPEGKVRDVRVDLPPGLAVNPEATVKCSEAQLNEFKCPTGSKVGVDKAVGTAELTLGIKTTVTEEFPVYNMVRKAGQPARFGVELNSETLKLVGLQGHIYLEGGISWHHEASTSESSGVPTGDFHEFFQIREIPQKPEIVESKLIFWGVPGEHNGDGSPTAFITLPSTCSSKPVTWLHVDSWENPGNYLAAKNETPVTATGCSSLAFNPTIKLSPETTALDAADGASVDLHIPQLMNESSKPDSPDLLNTTVTLPPGMSLNPAAARGLQACTNAQIGIGTANAITCPKESQIGTVSINAPGIPNGSLTGALYVAQPEAGKGPESGGEFRVFLAASAPAYGVGLRLEGRVKASVSTGQLTTTFTNTPQVPFEDFVLQLKSGSRLVVANPLTCGPANPSGVLTPYGGAASANVQGTGFTVDGGSNLACPSPVPFSLSQSELAPKPTQAGAFSSFQYTIARPQGQQYPTQLTTVLPEGLLGEIPNIKLCGEPAAAKGECPAASQIGGVTALAGSGAQAFPFAGTVYLTGPYQGAPYGLSIVVPAKAGPYNLGNVKIRARIEVGLYDGRVRATAPVPTIFEGVPLRLRGITVAINAKEFLFNPTNCAALATESAVLSSAGATVPLASPFQATGCDKLPFSPAFAASASGHPSKKNGVSFDVRVTQSAHQANIHEVILQLPKQLPSRLETLNHACPAATFEAGPPPGQCGSTGKAGTATVSTPVLPDPLSGSAYLVGHGGESFPDLDLVLHGDNGVTVVLVGHTHIAEATGITTSSFETLPDVPISSVDISLPAGPLSALGALKLHTMCAEHLVAPTTLVSQSGATIKRDTPIALDGCPLTVLGHRVSKGRMLIKILAPAAGRLTISGAGLRKVTRKIKALGVHTVSVPLTKGGLGRVRAARRSHRHIEMRLRLSFMANGAHKATVRNARLKVGG